MSGRAATLVLLAAAAACDPGLPFVDYNGKQCFSDGGCPPGYACDSATDLCAAPSPTSGSTGASTASGASTSGSSSSSSSSGTSRTSSGTSTSGPSSATTSGGTPTYPIPGQSCTPVPATTSVTSPAYFVSPTGSDENDGSLASPFLTLAQAQSAMRQNHVTATYVRAGTYYLASTLALTALDNGESFLAYPGERPVLSGGVPLTGWVLDAGGIWSTSISTAQLSGWTFDVLNVNGATATPARSPNGSPADPTAQFHVAMDTDGGATSFSFKPGDVTTTYPASHDVRISIMSGPEFSTTTAALSAVDLDAGTITLAQPALFGITAGNRYYLYNALEMLDAPGEWYLDEGSGVLLYLPGADAGFDGGGAVAPRLSTIISIDGASSVALVGFDFRDTVATVAASFTSGTSPQAGAAIQIANSSQVTIQGNRLVGMGDCAISATGSYALDIVANEVAQPGFSAITLAQTTSSEVSGNYVHDVGYWQKDSAGVALSDQSASNSVTNNLFNNCSGTAVSVFTITGNATGNVVDYNEIVGTDREVERSGSILTLALDNQDQQGASWRYNVIRHVGGFGDQPDGTPLIDPGCYGLTLSTGAAGVTIFGNVVDAQGHGGGINCYGCSAVTFQNNLIARAQWIPAYLDHARPPYQASDNVFTNNVVYDDGRGLPLSSYPVTDRWFVATDDMVPQDYSLFDGNVYWEVGYPSYDPFAIDAFPFDNGNWGGQSFAGWQDGGRDLHSAIGDPLITDLDGGDYSLSNASPAVSLGFEAIPFASIGLQAAPQGFKCQ